MAGRSPVSANGEQRRALVELGRSRDRAEADRARAILLTLAGWTSPDIAAAFGVREDTVRLWRGAMVGTLARQTPHNPVVDAGSGRNIGPMPKRRPANTPEGNNKE